MKRVTFLLHSSAWGHKTPCPRRLSAPSCDPYPCHFWPPRVHNVPPAHTVSHPGTCVCYLSTCMQCSLYTWTHATWMHVYRDACVWVPASPPFLHPPATPHRCHLWAWLSAWFPGRVGKKLHFPALPAQQEEEAASTAHRGAGLSAGGARRC